MMVHYRKDENGNIILSEYMFNRLMKLAHNKEKENKELKKEIKEVRELINYYGITPEENDDTTCRSILKQFLGILDKVEE